MLGVAPAHCCCCHAHFLERETEAQEVVRTDRDRQGIDPKPGLGHASLSFIPHWSRGRRWSPRDHVTSGKPLPSLSSVGPSREWSAQKVNTCLGFVCTRFSPWGEVTCGSSPSFIDWETEARKDQVLAKSYIRGQSPGTPAPLQRRGGCSPQPRGLEFSASWEAALLERLVTLPQWLRPDTIPPSTLGPRSPELPGLGRRGPGGRMWTAPPAGFLPLGGFSVCLCRFISILFTGSLHPCLCLRVRVFVALFCVSVSPSVSLYVSLVPYVSPSFCLSLLVSPFFGCLFVSF